MITWHFVNNNMHKFIFAYHTYAEFLMEHRHICFACVYVHAGEEILGSSFSPCGVVICVPVNPVDYVVTHVEIRL